jgi:hypothetical protein
MRLAPVLFLSASLGALGLQASAAMETAVAGAEYDRSFLGRQALGNNYRDLWKTPIQVPMLDLRHYAGGLRPVRTVGGGQTLGLALEGADGRSYTFRPIDKDARRHLDEESQGGLAGEIFKDQTSAAHPASSIIVTPLASAAGVLHTTPHLAVMPDSPALGEFRTTFAGVLGTIDVFPQDATEAPPGFARAREIVSTDDLLERIRKGPEERIDAPAYVRARLFDVFIGDWDRHGGNWRWARLPGREEWVPLPEDRDLAFANYEGIMLFWARFFDPRLITFRASYPSAEGMTRQAAPLDSVLLASVPAWIWEVTALDLTKRLHDDVIDAAIHRMPAEYREISGEALAANLRERRDRLPDMADTIYLQLSREVDVHVTDVPEWIEVRWLPGGDLVIRVIEGRAEEPWFERRFRRGETERVRIVGPFGDDFVSYQGSRGFRGIHVEVVPPAPE